MSHHWRPYLSIGAAGTRAELSTVVSTGPPLGDDTR